MPMSSPLPDVPIAPSFLEGTSSVTALARDSVSGYYGMAVNLELPTPDDKDAFSDTPATFVATQAPTIMTMVSPSATPGDDSETSLPTAYRSFISRNSNTGIRDAICLCI
jgi:hypothetical protein